VAVRDTDLVSWVNPWWTSVLKKTQKPNKKGSDRCGALLAAAGAIIPPRTSVGILI